MRVVRVLWMRFTFLVVIFLSGSIYADDKIYEWMLKQYEAKNETIIDNQVDVNIDGEPHFVIVARDVDAERDADTSTDKQYLGVFKKIQGKFVSVALARLTDVGYQEYPIAEIKNNAIFLMTTYCHHGCYYKRYQFKKINQRLKLVGFEELNRRFENNRDELKSELNRIRRGRKVHFWANAGTMKISTIHSFKGWEIHTLFLLIRNIGGSESSGFLNELIYTALTRAKSNIIIINSASAYDEFFKSVM